MRSEFIGLISCVCLAGAFASCSSTSPQVGEKSTQSKLNKGVTVTESESRYLLPSGKLGGEESALIEAKATVEKIDHTSRLITIRSAEGELTTLKAGSEIRNFNQIDRGDEVAVEYYLSVAFEAREPTASELEMDNSALALSGRAALGEKPGMRAAQGRVKVVTVESINKGKQLVVVRDLAGNYSTVKAKYPENLAYISEGDKIVVTVTEALAARITRVQ